MAPNKKNATYNNILLAIEGDNSEWKLKAACRSGTVRFHPPTMTATGGRAYPRNWDEEARETCAECPVGGFDGPCFQQAMILNEHGIWAGTDDYERGVLRYYASKESDNGMGGRTTTNLRTRPGPCPDCGGRWSVHLNASTGTSGDPDLVKCLECYLKWKWDSTKGLDSEAQDVVGCTS